MNRVTPFVARAASWLRAPWLCWCWRIGGSLLAVGVLVMGTLHVVVQLAHTEETVVLSYDDPAVRTLVVDSDAGAVRVTGYPGSTIRVTARVSDGLASTRRSSVVEGDRLVLRTRCPNLLSSFCSVSYLVEVPRHLGVDIRTENGRVAVIGVDGPVSVATRHSGIEVDGVQGPVELRSTHGSVLASNLRAGVATATSDHGAVSLGFATPPETVVARSTHGAVEVVVPADGTAYRLDAHSAFAGIDILVPTDPASDRAITATSTHAAVTVRT